MRNLLEQINSFEDAITTERGRFVSQFAGVRLASNFQPIYSPAHQQIVGHEALLRASNGHGAVPTSTVFSTASTVDEKLFLDRLCRVLHLRNYLAYVPNRPLPAWLFLNVSINTLNRNTHASSFFAEVLALYGFPAQRVVLEILEGRIPIPLYSRTLWLDIRIWVSWSRSTISARTVQTWIVCGGWRPISSNLTAV
jgi:EAL domain-containing protein (putative c-di-GMP-specific phosphodiesterase class I)